MQLRRDMWYADSVPLVPFFSILHQYHYHNDYAEGYVWQDTELLQTYHKEMERQKALQRKQVSKHMKSDVNHASGSNLGYQSSILDKDDIFESDSESYSTVERINSKSNHYKGIFYYKLLFKLNKFVCF